jgi:hypothetical protein
MKKNKFYLLFIILLVMMQVLVGCQSSPLQETEVETWNTLREWLPERVGYTNYYSVPTVELSYETLVKIEQTPEEGTILFWYEGQGITGYDDRIDSGHVRKLQLSKDILYESINGREIILLKAPLKEKESWQTPMWLPELGWVNAVASLDKISGDSLEISVKSTTANAKWKYTINKNMGMVKSESMINEQTRKMDFLVSNDMPHRSFVSRFVKPSTLLASFYKQDPRMYTNQITILKNEVNRIPEDSKHILYKQLLEELDSTDIRTIGLAAEMANIIMFSAVDDSDILSSFVTYYELVIESSKEEFESLLGFDSMLQIFEYVDKLGYFDVKNTEQISESELGAIAQLFKENGIGINFGQEITSLQPLPYYLSSTIVRSDSSNQLFIELKEWEYKHANKVLGDHQALNWNDLANHIVELERFVLTYPDYPLVDVMKNQLITNRNTYLAPVTNEIAQRKFNNGLIGEGIKSSYEYTLQEHFGTELFSDVASIYAQLKADMWLWTPTYQNILIKLGMIPADVSFNNGYSESAVNQLLNFKEQNRLFREEEVINLEEEIQTVEYEKILVGTTKELLNAIGSNKVIQLKPGIYNLDEITITPNVRFDFGQLVIHNVENLTIESQKKELFVHFISNSESTVIKFDSCKNIQLNNIRLVRGIDASLTPLLGIQHSSDVFINQCIFSGPSAKGIELRYTSNVQIRASQFEGLDAEALSFDNVEGFLLKKSFMTNLGSTVLTAYKSEALTLEDVQILNATGSSQNGEALFLLNNASLTIKNIQITDSSYEPDVNDEGLTILLNED